MAEVSASCRPAAADGGGQLVGVGDPDRLGRRGPTLWAIAGMATLIIEVSSTDNDHGQTDGQHRQPRRGMARPPAGTAMQAALRPGLKTPVSLAACLWRRRRPGRP